MPSMKGISALGLAATTLFFLRALGACLGEDPSLTTSADASGDANGSTGDASEDDFAFEPQTLDVDPGQNSVLTIRGGAGLSVALNVVVEPIPDAGVPSTTVGLGAASISIPASGEATVQVQVPAAVSQHHFRIVGTAGSRTHDVKGRVAGKPGEVDLYFGDRGGYLELAPDGDCTARKVLVQPDGKFVVGGTARSYKNVWIARFMRSGELDPTFGPTKAGFVTLGEGRGTEIELMPDGSIAIAAMAPNDPRLWRVSASGIPDPAWGGETGLDPQLGGGNFEGVAFGRQGDNILVGGDLPDNATGTIKRYLPDGGVDPSWAQGGSTTFTIGPMAGVNSSPRLHVLAVESGGTFWVGGQYSTNAGAPYERTFVRRFHADGTKETVDIDGTLNGAVTALALQDGKAVAAGFEYPEGQYSIYGFRVSSSVDGSFGLNGRALIAPPPGGYITSMAVDAEKRIYAANGGWPNENFDVYRLTASGTLDSTFGQSGLARIPSGLAYGVAIDGRQLVVVGVNDAKDARRARIARIWR